MAAPFGQHASQLVAHALARHGVNFLRELLHRLKRAWLDGIFKACGEAHGAQHAQLVFCEAQSRVADGADDSGLQIVAAANEVEHLAAYRIEHHSVNGEIAASHILSRVLRKAYLVGMPAIGVSDIAAESCNF